MNEQHNHHCRLTFAGRDWWIVSCSKNAIDVIRPIGYGHCYAYATINTRDIDWEAYAEAANAWDFRREV